MSHFTFAITSANFPLFYVKNRLFKIMRLGLFIALHSFVLSVSDSFDSEGFGHLLKKNVFKCMGQNTSQQFLILKGQ